MVCMKCGKELPDDARFCLSCGEALPATEETQEKTEQPVISEAETEHAAKPVSRKKTVMVIAGVLVALVVCAAVCLGIVAACIEAIRPKSLKFASSDNMSYGGEIMSLSFSTSGAGIVEFWTDSSGDGRLEMDGWIYYLSDVDSLVGPMERAIEELS